MIGFQYKTHKISIVSELKTSETNMKDIKKRVLNLNSCQKVFLSIGKIKKIG
jgi:hypothetical protein